jgi:Putative metallopeptidase
MAEMPALSNRGVSLPQLPQFFVLLFVLMSGTEPVDAQPAPSPSASVSQPSRIDAAAQALRDSSPRLKGASQEYVQGLAEFVTGNLLFVVLHEMAHTSITQMGLPVLGKMEDAADTFATLRLIRAGSDFSRRVLINAAKGWFLADRRDEKMGDKVAFYDEHGLNQQRAYEIVCLMVGSDDEKFKDLAKETKLPPDRQDSCAGDYTNAAYSWDLVLKPHRRSPDQPKTRIDVVYGPAEGRAAVAEQVNRAIRLLETVAARAADDFVWPFPFTLEMQSCGFPNARWDLQSRKLTVCYELATDFADLYRDYGARAESTRLVDSSKRKIIGASAFKPNRQKTPRKRRLNH